MTNKEKKEYLAKEWVIRAQDDERAVEAILKDKDFPPNPVCFFSQQIAEKMLKVSLTAHKIRFAKTHSLENLLELCRKIGVGFGQFKKEARDLSLFYISSRYPSDTLIFSSKEAKEAFAKAQKLKNYILDKIF